MLILPSTAESRGLIGERQLALMRQGALLVNAARGPIVDTDALVEALNSGRIRAALDVTDPEPLPEGHPLWSCPNLLLTPHVGGSTPQFAPRALRMAADELRRYMNGEPLQNVVQAASLDIRLSSRRGASRAGRARPEAHKARIEQRRWPQILVDIFADVDRVHDNPEPPVGDVLARLPPSCDEAVARQHGVEMRQRGIETLGQRSQQQSSPPRPATRATIQARACGAAPRALRLHRARRATSATSHRA